jgi:hypothetical protein
MKVLIVGKGPTHNSEIPYDEYDEVWVLNGSDSNNREPYTEKFDKWFDLHNFEGEDTKHIVTQDYINFIDSIGDKAVLMFEHQQAPNATIFPHKEITDKFTPYFTNSISWMIAYAITLGCEKLGLYGVHMAHSSEYGQQRPSCEYYIGLARGMGIEVEIQKNSTLLQSSYLYGLDETNPIVDYVKCEKKELEKRLKETEDKLNKTNVDYAVIHSVRNCVGAIIEAQDKAQIINQIVETFEQKNIELSQVLNILRNDYIVLKTRINTHEDTIMNWQ